MTRLNPPGERRRIGVRLTLVLLVLVPMASVAALIATDTANQWRGWHQAETVAREANQLDQVARAENGYEHAAALAYIVAYGANLGLGIPVLDRFMGENLDSAMSAYGDPLRTNPALQASPALRRATDVFLASLQGVQDRTTSLSQAVTEDLRFRNTIDDLWSSGCGRLRDAVQAWQTTGTFGDQVVTLQEVYTGAQSLASEVVDLSYLGIGMGDILSPLSHIPGTPSDPVKYGLLMAAGAYAEAVGAFQHQLDPSEAAAWRHVQDTPEMRAVDFVAQMSILTVQNPDVATFLAHPAELGPDAHDAAVALSDMNQLVVVVGRSVSHAATGQASAAQRRFAEETALLLLVAAVCVAGVIVTSNALTRPLKRLGVAAGRIRGGEFAVDQLVATGPRELAFTTDAFNEMTSTLKGLEDRTLALSAEDFSNPVLSTPMPGRTGQALQVAVDLLMARIHEREAQRKALHEQVMHDPMTGLLSRAAVFDYLATDVTRRRNAGETVAVLFADLDGLKSFNDTFGHDAGDEAIVQTAEAACCVTEPCDVVGRLGGDEFLIVLCNGHSRAAHDIADALRAEVSRRSVRKGDAVLPLRCSVGVAIAECDAGTDPMELVKRADEVMYEAKKAARSSREHQLAEP